MNTIIKTPDTYNNKKCVNTDSDAVSSPSTVFLVAVMLVSLFYGGMTNAEQNTDQLAAAAAEFNHQIRTIGEKDSEVAERAGLLRTTTRNLAKDGENAFGSDEYRKDFSRVKSLVAEIGGMEINNAAPIVNSWRDVHSSIKAIDASLARGGNRSITQSDRSDGNNDRGQGKNDDAFEHSEVSAAKNGPSTGMHIDQVEDLSERVKNAYRELTNRRKDMRDKEWTQRMDGLLSAFDQNANKLRDGYKAGSNWKPVLVAMKRQAQRVDRFLEVRQVGGGLRPDWNKLKQHLEKI